jgi:molecular chaperone GrpE
VPATETQEPEILQESEELTEVERLQAAVEELKAEVQDYKDQYLRKHADFENFRKRMLREKEESIRYANTALLKDIIGVIDDFERAIGSAQESKDFDSFLSGIQLIEKQFVSMLENNWGLKRMETVGEEFDPQRHEALMMEENPECDTETVLEDFQRGYSLNDRVIRHAKVKVGKPLAETSEQA